MANESPKRPIRRVPVPSTLKKEVPKTLPKVAKESKVGQNLLLLFLLLLVSGLVYLAIFNKKFIAKFSPTKSSSNKAIIADTISSNADSIIVEEEVSNVLGENNQSITNSEFDNNNEPKVYPAGTKFYLVVGSYIFYPYAQKCKARMIADGFNAKIISSGEPRKFHRIYIESSDDEAAMNARRDELSNTRGLNVWVYGE